MIIAVQTMIPNIGTSGTNGVLNGLCRLGSFLRRIITPAQTSTKANNVAMLVKSSTKVLSVNRIGTPTTNPVTIVAKEGVLNL